MPALTVVLALLALLGHAALCVGYVNRIHATGLHRRVIKLNSALGHAALVFLPVIAAALWWTSGISLTDWLSQMARQPAAADLSRRLLDHRRQHYRPMDRPLLADTEAKVHPLRSVDRRRRRRAVGS